MRQQRIGRRRLSVDRLLQSGQCFGLWIVASDLSTEEITLILDTMIEFCRAGLPSFKRPRRIVFVTEYPTTATGKIRRVELRQAEVERSATGNRNPAEFREEDFPELAGR